MRSGISELDAIDNVMTLPSFDAGSHNGNIVVASAEACQVAVYDVAGKLVLNTQVAAGETVIEAQSLRQGIYIVRASNGNAVKILK